MTAYDARAKISETVIDNFVDRVVLIMEISFGV